MYCADYSQISEKSEIIFRNNNNKKMSFSISTSSSDEMPPKQQTRKRSQTSMSQPKKNSLTGGSDSDDNMSEVSTSSSSSIKVPTNSKKPTKRLSNANENSEQGGYFNRGDDDFLRNFQSGANWWQDTPVSSQQASKPPVSSQLAPPSSKSSSSSSKPKDTTANEGQDTIEPQSPEALPPQQENELDDNMVDAVIMFDPTTLMAEKENSEEEKVLQMEFKTPLVYTVGFAILLVIHFGLSAYLGNWKLKFSNQNPLFGITETSLVISGAAYSPLVTGGEWWRFFTSMSLTAGVIHLVFIILGLGLLYEVERYNGFWVAFLLFFIGAVLGQVLSLLFAPLTLVTGPNGGVCAWLGFAITRLIATFHQKKRYIFLTFEILFLVAMIIIGFMPYNNNYQNFGGLIIGILISITLLPNNATTKGAAVCRGILSFLSFPILIIIFSLAVVFYMYGSDVSTWCPGCAKFACIDFAKMGWCSSTSETLESVLAANGSATTK